jgi:Tetratricopeptide repeat
MRRVRIVRGWWLLGVAAVGGAVAAWWAGSLPAVAGSAVIALAAAVEGVLSRRGTQVLEEAAGRSLEMRHKLLRDRWGRLPRMREVTDLLSIGVHRAGHSDSRADPEFVRRDMSGALESALAKHPFVIVVGESTAGKSRAAFEAARVMLPDYRLILPDPDDRTSLRAAVAAAERERRCVIWLDDLERYLGADGLTAHVVRKVLSGHGTGSCVIVGTIRAQERALFGGILADDDGSLAAGDQRAGRRVLDLAKEVRLDRRWSTAEIERARAVRGDRRIADAVDHADRYGIAEYLAAGPQLLAAWRDAWAPEGGHARGAALVAAAVDGQRAGWRRPLPLGLLQELHEHYLSARGGMMLRPEPWADALAWAVTPLYATSSLLLPSERDSDAVLAFDYLPDAVDADPAITAIPAETWSLLITAADPATCVDIGWEADLHHCRQIAATAFRKAIDGGVIAGAPGLATILGVAGDTDDAAEVLRSAIDSATADTDPAVLVELRDALSWWMGQSGDYAEALQLATASHDTLQRLYGREHEATLFSAIGVAKWTGQSGHPADALKQAKEVYARCLRSLGPDHRATLNSRFEIALLTGVIGDADEAERFWTDLDADATRVLGDLDRFTNDARWNLARIMLENGNVASALRLLDSVVDGRAGMFGVDHPWTLVGRLEFAGETGEAGQAATALTLARSVTTDCRRIMGSHHILTLSGRFQVALWSALSGQGAEATALFTALLNDAETELGQDHQLVQACRAWLSGTTDQHIHYYLPPTW